ncbi:toxin-antitoxin system YwqK family antitoxin [Fusobacterium canifelinum]|uniref:Toxin-antitoxin system YwqK family antitoxin n=1 Tax=Fusobacterium canifelinum TaxID=285729 RepID=A0A3P1V398_9FUSO|nr:toxin-antitoxin system YwqK family antitoxin [Fusobacterium canifelinum]QQB73465.1 toxin-antitoxin system YwqK family antitoxin [Fusobacterium canifelinum]RRD28682.1 toxin-antitoxin system YwqK family antitoxin [Fusobacterium canifelinum]
MKKNFIIYIFIIFVLTSFSIFAEREVDFEELTYHEDTELIYVKGENEPFTGIRKDYYEDKSLKFEIPYKNGKKEGKGKEYYPSGKFKSDAFFVDDVLEGKAIGYYENGNLEYEENYKDGKLDGLVKDYFESGKIKAEINYKNGEADGPAKEYYENGQVRIQESYKNGELDGESLNFYKDGSLRSKAVYKNGELVGDIVQGEVGSVVAGDVPDTEEVSISSENKNIRDYVGIFIFCTVTIGIIIYTVFKIFTAFPKTNNLTDEQRNRIFKILMKYDEHKKELFSAYRLNGVGTGYYRVRSMIVDNEKVYIYAKMFSILYIPTPITLGYLLCYNKDRILASFSNATFKEAKKEIEESTLYL